MYCKNTDKGSSTYKLSELQKVKEKAEQALERLMKKRTFLTESLFFAEKLNYENMIAVIDRKIIEAEMEQIEQQS